MGFLGEIFQSHEDKGKKPAADGLPAVETAAVVAPQATGAETSTAGEVKSGSVGVDTVTGAGPATVDLKSMPAPTVSGENSSPDIASQPESAETSADSLATSEATGESADKSPVEPASTSDSSEVNISVDPVTAVESSDATTPSDGHETAADEDTSNKAAEEMLAKWQKEGPSGGVVAENADESPAENSDSGADHTVEPATEASGEEPDVGQAESDDQTPESAVGGTDEENLAKKLSEAAADEAGEIDKAMAASQAAPPAVEDESIKPEGAEEPSIQAVSSDILSDEKVGAEASVETTGEVATEHDASETSESTPEVSFPELKPEGAASSQVAEDAEVGNAGESAEADAEIGTEPPEEPISAIGGEDVHEGRQTFSTEGSDAGGDQLAGSAEKVVDLTAKRRALEKAKIEFDKAYQDAMEALDKAA